MDENESCRSYEKAVSLGAPPPAPQPAIYVRKANAAVGTFGDNVDCDVGDRALGGGGEPPDDLAPLLDSMPTKDGAPAQSGDVPNGWHARSQRNNGSLKIYVVCQDG